MARLIIGVGNPDRGDDGAGVLAARRLSGLGAREASDCSGLISLWSSRDEVVVVDAMQSGQPVGTITRFDATSLELPARAFVSSHAAGIAETVQLARALDRLPARLTVYGIEGARFGLGEAMSPEVSQAVDRVTAEIESRDG